MQNVPDIRGLHRQRVIQRQKRILPVELALTPIPVGRDISIQAKKPMKGLTRPNANRLIQPTRNAELRLQPRRLIRAALVDITIHLRQKLIEMVTPIQTFANQLIRAVPTVAQQEHIPITQTEHPNMDIPQNVPRQQKRVLFAELKIKLVHYTPDVPQ